MSGFLNRLAAGFLLLALSAAAYAEGNPMPGPDQKEANPQKRMEQAGKVEEAKENEKPAPAEREKPNKTGKSRPRRKENTQSGSPMPRTNSMPIDPN